MVSLDTTLKFDPRSNHLVMISSVEDYAGDGRPDGPPTLTGAGDIAHCGPGTEATGRLLDQIEGTIVTTWDNAYEKGEMSEYIEFVEDRKGHDFKYQLSTKHDLPAVKNQKKFNLKSTVKYYVDKYHKA